MNTTESNIDVKSRKERPTPAVTPQVRSVRDTCLVLSISRAHVYNLLSSGRLRCVKLGRRTLIPESEIARLLQEGA